MEFAAIYNQPVIDLGDKCDDESLRGIYSPSYPDELLERFLNDQFTRDAAIYAKQSEHTRASGSLLERALRTCGHEGLKEQARQILDLGSGAGNSVLPILEKFPHANLIASDLSPNMLLALKQNLLNANLLNRCTLMQLNAEEPDFKSASMDLVVGFAVLHHLFKPDKTILGCANILKDDGVAIFVEPFENGNYMLAQLYKQILGHQCASELDPKVKTVLSNRICFVTDRIGLDKSDPRFETYDDKWQFTRHGFQTFSRQAGFRDCLIMPVSQSATPFTEKTLFMLKRKTDLSEPLPTWALEIIGDFENTVSPEFLYELPNEATVIFMK